MIRAVLVFTCFVSGVCTIEAHTHTHIEFPKLLVVSFDGFPSELFNRTKTANILDLKLKGAYVEKLTSVFVPRTLSSHYSIATGVYPGSHGVIDDFIWDKRLKSEFNLSYQTSETFTYNDSNIPLWILNQQANDNRHSGAYKWPGGNFEIKKSHASHSIPFTKKENSTLEKKFDTVLTWFLDVKKPANLVLMYIDEPKNTIEQYGVHSNETIEMLERIDSALGYLVHTLKNITSLQALNLMITTGSGMMDTPVEDHIDLKSEIGKDPYEVHGCSPVLQVTLPTDDTKIMLFNKLKTWSVHQNASVYHKTQIPQHFHFDGNSRIPEVLVIADPGYTFTDYPCHKNQVVRATHGYDCVVEAMDGFFLGYGPAFKQSTIMTRASVLDIFPLMCHLLSIDIPHTDGDLRNLYPLLVPSLIEIIQANKPIALYSSAIAIVVFIFAVCFVYKCTLYIKRYKRRKELTKYLSPGDMEEESAFQGYDENHLLLPSTFEGVQ